jgi:hypothetical protein
MDLHNIFDIIALASALARLIAAVQALFDRSADRRRRWEGKILDGHDGISEMTGRGLVGPRDDAKGEFAEPCRRSRSRKKVLRRGGTFC